LEAAQRRAKAGKDVMHAQGRRAVEALVMAKSPPYETIGVRPLTPVIGAEIEGVDLAGELSNRQFSEIRRAFLEHHVIVFRDQQLSDEDHKAFSRRFGRLHTHPLNAINGTTDPEVLVVKADNSSKYVAGEAWHTDVTCDEEPPMGSLLYIRETPEIGSGGDTLFANMHLAYDMLSEPMKAMLEGLTAIHDGAIPYAQAYGYTPEQAFPKNEHPVIVRHPDTGRKVLFVNRGFTSHIKQLTRFESQALLEMLYRIVETQPALQCRVRWTPNTLVFWDNRCTQHHASWDYFPLSRSGKRVSVIGTRPTS
jgi:taurine dioxygenase